MPTYIKPTTIVDQAPALATQVAKPAPTRPPESVRVTRDGLSLEGVRPAMREVLAAETRLHAALGHLHAGQEALEAALHVPGIPGEHTDLATAFSQVEKFAAAMREARAKVLENGPIPSRESAEYIANLVAEQAAKRADIVSIVASGLPESVLELTA